MKTHRTSLTLLIGMSLLCALTISGITTADPGSKSTSTKKTTPTLSQQAVGLAFAREHHAELADLMEQLRKSNPTAFREGVLELHATAQRIEKLQERSPQRYQDTLTLWKLDSRIRLLGARIRMDGESAHRDELRKLLTQRHDVRLKIQKTERDRLQARLKKLNESISEMETDRDETIERDLDRLARQTRPNKGKKPK